jgi:hypothetical protein
VAARDFRRAGRGRACRAIDCAAFSYSALAIRAAECAGRGNLVGRKTNASRTGADRGTGTGASSISASSTSAACNTSTHYRWRQATAEYPWRKFVLATGRSAEHG